MEELLHKRLFIVGSMLFDPIGGYYLEVTAGTADLWQDVKGEVCKNSSTFDYMYCRVHKTTVFKTPVFPLIFNTKIQILCINTRL